MKKHVRHDYLSRADSITGMVEMSRELGHPLEPMMARFGFSMDLFGDPEAHISFNALCRMFEACAEDWNCPDFGIRLAGVQNLNIFGPVGLVTRLSDTVGGALRALQSHMAAHSTGYVTELVPGDAALGAPALITFTPKPDSDAGRQIIELSIGIARNILAIISGMSQFRPIRVTFVHPPPADQQPARKFFGCPVEYLQPENSLSFSADLLNKSTAVRDTALAPIIRAYFEQNKAKFELNLVESTRQLIGKLLATGRCSREAVADCLHMHPRTLQRRLNEEGVSFQHLLDDYRRALALELIKRQTMPLTHVAAALGYADQSSFNQAFRRWTDSTPTKVKVGA